MSLFGFRSKRVNDLNDVRSDADRVYGTQPQQDYARKMAEELLKRKPENIRHWTQGVAYLMDTLAGIQYQNIAGEKEFQLVTNEPFRGLNPESPAYRGPPTAAIPPSPEPGAGPTVTVDPTPEARAKLGVLAPEKAEPAAPPVPPPTEITTGDILKGATAPIEVPTPVKASMADKPKKHPFDLGAKGVPIEPSAPTPEGWTPTIKPFVDEKAPYMSRKRDMSKVSNIVFHHDSSWKKEMSDVENAERLAKYGRSVDRKRGFDPGYHYYISRDGTIIQGTPDDRTTHHVRNGKFGVGNNNSIGIAFTGSDSDKTPPTDAQIKAAEFLGNKLMKDYNIKPDRIYGHGEINPGHRGEKEGMHGVNLFRGKPAAVAEAPAAPVAPTETPMMGLGGPRAAEAPVAPPSEPDLVHMAQYRAGTPDVPPQPYGPQPSVAQQPLPAVPAMTQEDLIRMNMANPRDIAGNLEKFRRSQEPVKRDLTTPHQLVEPAQEGRVPRYQTNMPVQGPTVTAPNGVSAHLQYQINPNTGQGEYVPPVGKIPTTMDRYMPGRPIDMAPPGVEPSSIPEKSGMDKFGDFINDLSRRGAVAANEGKRIEEGEKIAATFRERGVTAQNRIRDMDIIQSINNRYKDYVPTGAFAKWEPHYRATISRITGLSEEQLASLTGAEIKQKMLSQFTLGAESALRGRGSNLRLDMLERANPGMATSIRGSNAVAQIIKEQERLESKFAEQIENSKPGDTGKIVQMRNKFMEDNPLVIDIGDGKKTYIGKFGDMSLDEVKDKFKIRKGDVIVGPTGKLLEVTR